MRILHVPAALVLILVLAACSGYRMTSGDAPLALPEGTRTLFLKDVENPTLYPEAGAQLRALVRDEFTRRGGVVWTGPDEASAYLHLKIVSFTTSAAVTDEDDETLKSNASISLEGRITRRSDGSEVWRGRASHSESFLSDREAARESVIEHAARKLADALAQNY